MKTSNLFLIGLSLAVIILCVVMIFKKESYIAPTQAYIRALPSSKSRQIKQRKMPYSSSSLPPNIDQLVKGANVSESQNAELFHYMESGPMKEHFYYTMDSPQASQSPYLESPNNLIGHPTDSYYARSGLPTDQSNYFLDSYFENVGAGSNTDFNAPSDSLMMAQNAARGAGDINGLVGEMDIVYHNLAETKGINL